MDCRFNINSIKATVMEEEIYKICTKLNDGQIAVTQASELLLILFSGRHSKELVCPCCGSDKTYLTDAIHCNRCATTTEI